MTSVISKYWWAFALRGLFAILLGLVALVMSEWELYVFARVLCIYALLDGLFAVIPSLSEVAEKTWWTLMIEGLIGVVVGVLTFLGPGGIGSALWPDVSSMMSLFVISSWAIIRGILEIIPGIRLPQQFAGKWVLCAAGAASILFGASALILRPGTGIVGAAWLIGIYAIPFGLLQAFFGLKGRSIGRPSQGRKARE